MGGASGGDSAIHERTDSAVAAGGPSHTRNSEQHESSERKVMKKKRQGQVLQTVKAEAIGSQEQLRRRLAERGYDVTQATLSRDLKDLRIVKAADPGGSGYRYRPLDEPRGRTPRSMVSGNLIVFHTEQGLAAALAYEIDAIGLPSLAGTVAGEDTILAVVAEGHRAADVEQAIWSILK